jgi:TonB family protein
MVGRTIEGKVTVRFVILPDASLEPSSQGGRNRPVKVHKGSGSALLDRAAVRTVLRARRRFPPFPAELGRERLVMIFEFDFTLQKP